MGDITRFSNEVCQKINYYVYRLIDPRNGETFYVGKGKGNRVFQHVKATIGYYDGAEGREDSDPNKIKIIKRIIDSGLNVIHVIHRWNLTEKEAFQVEAALIDAYAGLTNLQNGHASEYGVTNAELLQQCLGCEIYEEPSDFKYMIIKVHDWRMDEVAENNPDADARYEATRYCWRINPRSIDEYSYVFSVSDGIVKAVYKISEWKRVESNGRYEFIGEPAEENINNRFVGHRIPDIYCKKGMAQPVLFSKNAVL